jgi:D-alanine-D-alanine ligase
MYLASNKLLAKRLLSQSGIDTPTWCGAEQALASGPTFEPPYIVKSVWDNASLGLECIFADRRRLHGYLNDLAATTRLADRFVERYIEGREFNVSMLQDGALVQILPVAEMLFVNFPPQRPRIVGYAAKWDPASFEYTHTVRRFDFGRGDEELIDGLGELARACWEQLGLGGYARADFRVDPQGTPWILEVNPNPCIGADVGFAAAAKRAGLSYPQLVQRILQPALERTAAADLWLAERIGL